MNGFYAQISGCEFLTVLKHLILPTTIQKVLTGQIVAPFLNFLNLVIAKD